MQFYPNHKRIVYITQIMLQWCQHEIKVTYINGGWNVRCFTNGEVNQEIRVFKKKDVGWAARDMLRWEDKCGNWSDFASKSRHRAGIKSNKRTGLCKPSIS
jgi:hypothetical protein